MGKKNGKKNERKRHHKHQGGQKKPHQHHAERKKEPFVKQQRNNNVKNTDRQTQNTWTPKNNLFEKDINVTEFVGTAPGFTGIIKARFSDFQVNEIDMDGNIVKLTDIQIPAQPKTDVANITENEQKVVELITVEVWDQINNIAKSDPKEKLSVELVVDHLSKEQRSLIHNTIKEIYGKSLVGSTADKGGKKYIRFARFTKGDKDNRTKWVWPHEYTYFVVHKENVDTMKAASDLAHNLNTNVSSLAYAGTKDKRGKTSQWFCIRKREPEKIARAAERFPNVHVGNFTFKPDTLKLGVLKGNRFRIALRHVTAETSVIDQSLTSLRENGFINYYGLQRFGNSAVTPTHQIGLALLRGKFQEAVELILKPREGEAHFMKAVREHWWRNRDGAAALKLLFKTNTGIEAKLLAGLARNGPNDFVNALENVPRNMRLLYIHAYQSLIWNEIASRRFKLGAQVLPGDLVFVEDADHSEEITDEVDLLNSVEEDADQDASEKPEPVEEESRFKTMVRPLTEQDVASGKFSIFDVVLPLPGHDITYPSNECGKWYADRLALDGLSSEKLKTKQKSYSLTGAYRKLILKPANLTWELIKYNEETDNLIQSDWEELKNENKPEPKEDGKLLALVVDFCLPSSTYATMVLREILKQDTSASSQTLLNKAEADAAKLTDADGDVAVTAEKRKIAEDEVEDDAKRIKLEIATQE